MAKYKVGDKVRVRSDLKTGERYGCMHFTEYMKGQVGKVVTIEDWTGISYKIMENDRPHWTDEMFEGLAEKEPKSYYKVRCIGYNDREKSFTVGKVYEVKNNSITSDTGYNYHDEDDVIKWLKPWYNFELVEEEPKKEPTPTPVTNINVTVNLYENACWYCRKGGLVDIYLAGVMGICPSCGRVCNNTVHTTKKESVVIEFKPKKNEPLTTEELKALPDGTRVFTVFVENGEEKLKDYYTCWRVKKGDLVKRKGGHYTVNGNGKNYHTYLEMPEGAVDSGE